MLEHNDELLDEIGDLLATHYEVWKEQPQEGPEVAFGRYLAATRQQQQLSIAELAQRAGLPESEILAYEHGLIPPNRIKAQPLQALAAALAEELPTFLLILGVDIGTDPVASTQHPGAPATGHRFAPDGNQATARLTPLPISPTLTGRLRLVGRVQLPGTEFTPTAPIRLLAQRLQQLVTPLVVSALLFWVGAAHFRSSQPVPPASGPERSNCANSPNTAGDASCPEAQLAAAPAAPTSRVVAVEAARTVPNAPVILGRTVSAPSAAAGEPITPPASQASLTENAAEADPMAVPAVAVGFPSQARAPAQPSEPSLPAEVAAESPTEHRVQELENLWCIAKKYYDDGDLYPLICQYNFGDASCAQPLRPGDLLRIPVLDDFTADKLALDTLPLSITAPKLELFKQIGRETVSANRQKQRGVDYWCEENDDEIYTSQPLEPVAQLNNGEINVGLP